MHTLFVLGAVLPLQSASTELPSLALSPLVAYAIWLSAYLAVGVLLCLRIDASEKHYAVFDRYPVIVHYLCVLAWPIALPWVLRHDAR